MRNGVSDFSLANPIYKGATVTFYTVLAGVKTATKATLYAGLTGSSTLSNPQQLDSDGKFLAPVYVDEPVIAAITGLTIPDHDTGIIQAVLSAGSLADVLDDLAASSGSSLVGFIQSGAGAVATTVQAKLRERVSVLDFGASSAASASVNTAAIQAAIDSLTTGGTVFFPKGNYKINNTLYTSRNYNGSTLQYYPVNLIGEGRGATQITHDTGATGVMIWVGNYTQDTTTDVYQSRYCSVQDITLNTVVGTTYGFRFRQNYSLFLKDVVVQGTNVGGSPNAFGLRLALRGYISRLRRNSTRQQERRSA